MSGVGSSELIILILIGLIVLGPRRLPQIANQLGSWIGQARRMTRAMRRQLEDELNLDENFNIKPPKAAPPPIVSAAPGPADPAHDLDDDEPHVPNDDDTYSPLHEEDGDAADEQDEKSA
jgi:sec-independent protein translocase protein TatB